MGKAIVSTTLGSEGIDAIPGRDLLIEDQPEAFAHSVNRLLGDRSLELDTIGFRFHGNRGQQLRRSLYDCTGE